MHKEKEHIRKLARQCTFSMRIDVQIMSTVVELVKLFHTYRGIPRIIAAVYLTCCISEIILPWQWVMLIYCTCACMHEITYLSYQCSPKTKIEGIIGGISGWNLRSYLHQSFHSILLAIIILKVTCPGCAGRQLQMCMRHSHCVLCLYVHVCWTG